MDQAQMIKDLEVAKRILSNLNTQLDGMMRVRIGQVISEAIDALKMVGNETSLLSENR